MLKRTLTYEVERNMSNILFKLSEKHFKRTEKEIGRTAIQSHFNATSNKTSLLLKNYSSARNV